MKMFLGLVCFVFTFSTFIVEHVIKAILFLLVCVILFFMALFYPLVKYNYFWDFKCSSLYKYATTYGGGFPLSKFIYDAWS